MIFHRLHLSPLERHVRVKGLRQLYHMVQNEKGIPHIELPS